MKKNKINSKVTERRIAGKHNYVSRCAFDGIPKRVGTFGSQVRSRVPMKKGFERNNFILHTKRESWQICKRSRHDSYYILDGVLNFIK